MYFVLVVFNVRCEKRMEVINELRRVLFYAEEGEQLHTSVSDDSELIYTVSQEKGPRHY